jgi:prefoldin subunit 5
MGSEGMRNWAKIKKLENERHDLEKKITELMKRLREVEEEIHKLGGM